MVCESSNNRPGRFGFRNLAGRFNEKQNFVLGIAGFFEMRAEEEIWPVVLIAGSIVAVLMILAFSDPGTFVCVGVCE